MSKSNHSSTPPDTPAGSGNCLRVQIPSDKEGERLDRVLADASDELSRSRLKALIEDGSVSGPGGVVTEARRKVRAGEAYVVQLPPPPEDGPVAQKLPLDIIYEDDDIIVIDKPAGLVVHPAAGNRDGTLVNALLEHCGPSLRNVGGAARPGIVHRLDKGTSGVMVAAKLPRAYHHLTDAFSRHDIERAYEAVAWGLPSPASGNIEGNIGRSPRNRKKMAVLERGGKPALTRYKVLSRSPNGLASLVRCELETGRTHQIRVHLASIGHAIVGDPLYGKGPRRSQLSEEVRGILGEIDRPLLHAVHLGIRHPASGELMQFSSEKPQFFKGLISSF